MCWKRFCQIFTGLVLCCLLSINANAGMATFSDREDVHRFIMHMVNDYGFNETILTNIFNQVRLRSDILRQINPPPPVRHGIVRINPWYHYRTIFLTDTRANSGAWFWNAHKKALEIAERKYGVPPDIIIAIVGVETQYGNFLGRYRVIDALSTLAFSYSPREHYFRHELEQYLLLTREQNLNPLAVHGSYAGAIGMPQFMPSNYRALGVSYTGHSKPNLIANPNDVIISVANYFKSHGWVRGQFVAVRATVSGNKYLRLTSNKLQPIYTIAEWEAYGVKPTKPLAKHQKAILFQLQVAPNEYHYWFGLNNFYVITKYNSSLYYAMAVYELSQMIQDRKAQNKTHLTS